MIGRWFFWFYWFSAACVWGLMVWLVLGFSIGGLGEGIRFWDCLGYTCDYGYIYICV